MLLKNMLCCLLAGVSFYGPCSTWKAGLLDQVFFISANLVLFLNLIWLERLSVDCLIIACVLSTDIERR